MSNLQQRSQFYYQLATLLEAGVSMAGVFRRGYPPSFSNAVNELHQMVSRGLRLSCSMRTIPQFTAFDIALVTVGERTGRLPECCRALAQWYDRLHRIRQSLIVSLLYPLMVYLLAGPLLTVVDVATGARTLDSALIRLVVWLAMPWLLLLVGKLLLPLLRGKIWLGAILNQLPVAGEIIFQLEAANFFQSLALCLNAGDGVVSSIQTAAETCTNPFYRNRYKLLAVHIQQQGCGFSEALLATLMSREAHSSIPTLIQTGEQAGQLPESCARIAQFCLDSAETRMAVLAKILPITLYMILVIFLAFRIIGFYAGYLGQINQLLQ